MRHTSIVLAGAVLVATASVGRTAAAQEASLETMSENANQWVMTGRTYDLQRYSPLTQINATNVAHLHAAWSFSTGTLRGHEGNPLVIGSVMYLHSSFPNKVYALDLSKPGAPQIWQYTPEQDANVIPIACCDVVNRGLAYHPSGKLYIELLQGDLLALDAKTGKKVFQVKSADFHKGETMTNAPLVVRTSSLRGSRAASLASGAASPPLMPWMGTSCGGRIRRGRTPRSRSRARRTPTIRRCRGRTWASRRGRAMSGSTGAGRPGAGTPMTRS